jgi:ATP-dependent DNA helicase RecQ
LCLVISPLIALMKDQVLNLNKRGIPATAIFTGMSPGEIDIILEQCAAGKYRFLYVSPERLTTRLLRDRLHRLQVRLLAIDEAHCIAQWGHDFRPEYLRIAEIRPKLPHVPIIALTATATPRVVTEIQEKLGFKKGQIFQKSFRRNNLAYVVAYTEDKYGKLLELVKNEAGTGVVYAGTRRKTQLLADYLKRHGQNADYYHAGLSSKERDARQKDWINNRIRVICCTNAFGMGIDKPDVRFVIHFEPSDCIEAYFQEAGRAGRDEQPAKCSLLFHPADRAEAERRLALGFPPLDTIRLVYKALGTHFGLAVGSGQWQSFPFDLQEFCTNYNFLPTVVHHSLQFLHRSGYLIAGEDVLLPSKARFTASPETIYDFRLRHREFDPFIDLLLRSYSGIMEQYVRIDEYKLAGRLKILATDIAGLLKRLQQFELLDYVPKSDKPLITWLKERLPEGKVILAPEHYAALHEQKAAQLSAMLSYCETRGQCRSQILLNYFGENKSEACGECDHCKGHQLQEPDSDFTLEVISAMASWPIQTYNLEEWLELLPFENKKKLLNTINWLLDQNRLQLNHQQKISWKA